jgi:hypothetical protein
MSTARPWLKPADPSVLAAGREAYFKQREAWKSLPLRQQWADEAHMRAIIRMSGIAKAPPDFEPATPERVNQLVKRTGISTPEIHEAIGCTTAEYVRKNENLPLWVAVAHVLELTGKFDYMREIH